VNLPDRPQAVINAIQAIQRTLDIPQADAAAWGGAIIAVLERLGVIVFPDTPTKFSLTKGEEM
jgi:hypothetical protein